jgi:hypothetical protein
MHSHHRIWALPLAVGAAFTMAACSEAPSSEGGGLAHIMSTDEHVGQSSSALNNGGPGNPSVALPILPHLTYYGGRVISNVQVVQVNWNSGGSFETHVTDGEMGTFYGGITNSRFFDWLSEYGTVGLDGADGTGGTAQQIGRGAFAGKYTITPSVTGTSITDAQIQTELASQIAGGAIPPVAFDSSGNPNTLYFIHFPKGVSISAPHGGTSCQQYCAYHYTFTSGGNDIYYAVMPDMSPGSGCDTKCKADLSPLARATVVASHELTEAVTDSEIGLAPSSILRDDAGTAILRPAAWYEADVAQSLAGLGGEIGDICQRFPPQPMVDDNGASWTVQTLWSNVSNECIVSHVSNGGFESGLAAWSTSGTVKKTALGHPGTSVQLGSPSVATGDSTVSQRFDLPDPVGGGTVTLSFAYGTVCTAGSGGWLSATVFDVATGATLALLPQTCLPAGGWLQSSLDVTNLHGDTIVLTMTNHDPTSAGSRTYSFVDSVAVTLNPPSAANPIVNPSFERDLSGWTWTGAADFTGIPFGEPAYTGRLSGVTGSPPAAGEGSLSQTFTAQSGASTVQFFSYVVCGDTVATDWATATLLDNTTGTTVTLMPKTCSNNATWNRISGTVVPGHSYTITLTSHDDGIGGNTTAYWDDVSVQ